MILYHMELKETIKTLNPAGLHNNSDYSFSYTISPTTKWSVIFKVSLTNRFLIKIRKFGTMHRQLTCLHILPLVLVFSLVFRTAQNRTAHNPKTLTFLRTGKWTFFFNFLYNTPRDTSYLYEYNYRHGRNVPFLY